MKKILLTGGSGFIGKNIKESYLVDKYEIIAPTHSELNLTDENSVRYFFLHNKIDVVIHAAVKPSHRNAKDLNNLFYINTRMFFNLERYSHLYEKMIVIGSGAIYDQRYYSPKMKEEDYAEYIPVDEHGFCKYVCGKIIEKSLNIYDLRIFGIFGKYEDYAIRFISNAICKALLDLPITIRQNRNFDYLFVDDLMPIMDWFIEHTPQHKSYNITPDSSVALYDLSQLIIKISGKELPVVVAQPGLGLEYSGDNTRLKKEFDKVCFTSIETSIAKLYDWYERNRDLIDRKILLIDK